MKNIYKKIAVSFVFALVSLFITTDTALAANSSVSFSPANISKNEGAVFDISFLIHPNGNKVCAIEGELVPINLSIVNITLSGKIIAQTAPTASSPKFLLGIPGCTIVESAVLTATVSAGNAGDASMGLRNLDIIGEGNTLGNAHTNATYTIVAVIPVTKTPIIKTIVTPKVEKEKIIDIGVNIKSDVFSTTTATSSQSASVIDSLKLGITSINIIWLIIAIIFGFLGYWIAVSRNKTRW